MLATAKSEEEQVLALQIALGKGSESFETKLVIKNRSDNLNTLWNF
jgi:hypothetical protein